MSKEQPSKRLERPNLHLSSSKWSTAQSGGIASRVAIVATIAAIFGGIGLVFVYPYFNIDRFRRIQKINRLGIDPEDTQPAGLPVWRDPFDRKKAD